MAAYDVFKTSGVSADDPCRGKAESMLFVRSKIGECCLRMLFSSRGTSRSRYRSQSRVTALRKSSSLNIVGFSKAASCCWIDATRVGHVEMLSSDLDIGSRGSRARVHDSSERNCWATPDILCRMAHPDGRSHQSMSWNTEYYLSCGDPVKRYWCHSASFEKPRVTSCLVVFTGRHTNRPLQA